MRLEKLTTKSQEALREAQSLAEKRNHQALDIEHLLFALLGQKEGVVLSLLQKLGVPLTEVADRLQKALDRVPQVTGASGQSYITPRLKKIIESAESEAEALKDDYVSTEHLRFTRRGTLPRRPSGIGCRAPWCWRRWQCWWGPWC